MRYWRHLGIFSRSYLDRDLALWWHDHWTLVRLCGGVRTLEQLCWLAQLVRLLLNAKVSSRVSDREFQSLEFKQLDHSR